MSSLSRGAQRRPATRRTAPWFFFALWIVFASCTQERSRRYVGYHVSGFEVSAFRPCSDQSESWWVAFRETYEQYDSLRDSLGLPRQLSYVQHDTVFVIWYGTLSRPGSYGHLNGYQREINVDSIVTIRRPRDGDCEAVIRDGEQASMENSVP